MIFHRSFIVTLIVLLAASALFCQDIMFPADTGGLWGYIDSTGSMVIKPQYIQVGNFSDGIAFVKKGVLSEEEFTFINAVGYINKKNEFKKISAIFQGLDKGEEFREGRAAVRKRGVGIFSQSRWGFIDTSFNMVIPPAHTRVGNFSEGLAWYEDKETFLFLVISEEYGYIDMQGTVVIKGDFENAGNFSEGLANITVHGKKGFLDKNGEIIIEPVYESVGKFSNGLAPVKLDGKWGFINSKDSLLIPIVYEDVRSFSEGVALVKYSGKWGFINLLGEFIISPQFTQAGNFSEGLAPVLLTDKWGFIDAEGNTVIEPQFDYAYGFRGGFSMVESDKMFGYINHSGQYIWRQYY